MKAEPIGCNAATAGWFTRWKCGLTTGAFSFGRGVMAGPHLLFALTGGGRHDPTQAQGQGREEVLMADVQANCAAFNMEAENAELRAENARLRAALAARQQDIAALQRWGADRLPLATVDARKFGYGPIGALTLDTIPRDQFDRNCRASVGMAAVPLDDHGEGEG